MERIGIAASKIAKGNLFLYNLFVILLTLLFSLLVFFVCGASIVIVLVAFDYAIKARALPSLEQGWIPVTMIAFFCLGVIIAIFALMAVCKNLKLKRNK